MFAVAMLSLVAASLLAACTIIYGNANHIIFDDNTSSGLIVFGAEQKDGKDQ